MKNKILFITLTILVSLYMLSFSGAFYRQKKSLIKETVILNPKYKDSISNIVLKKGKQELIFNKRDNQWILQFEENEMNFKIPVNQSNINNFINTLSKVVKISLISENNTNLKDYELDEPFFQINFSDGINLNTKLLIGKHAFSSSERFIMLENNKIYKIESELESYFNINPEFWFDAFLIPVSLSSENNSDIQKIEVQYNNRKNTLIPKDDFTFTEIKKLRHGSLLKKDFNHDDKQLSLKLNCEIGIDNYIEIRFYQNEENNYHVNYISKDWNYTCLLSQWTFNKLRELLCID